MEGEREQQTADMQLIRRIINEAVASFVKLGINPPAENTKNDYLKSCWIVAMYNKYGRREDGKYLAMTLPLLKAETEKAN